MTWGLWGSVTNMLILGLAWGSSEKDSSATRLRGLDFMFLLSSFHGQSLTFRGFPMTCFLRTDYRRKDLEMLLA